MNETIKQMRAFLDEALPSIVGDGSKTREHNRLFITAFLDNFEASKRKARIVHTTGIGQPHTTTDT